MMAKVQQQPHLCVELQQPHLCVEVATGGQVLVEQLVAEQVIRQQLCLVALVFCDDGQQSRGGSAAHRHRQ